MEDTNKTLALLLVAAIVVSLGGTIISLDRIGQLSITGFATSNQTGIVQFNITSATTLTLTQSTIDFGNGFVNSTCNNCTMWTNSSTSGTNYSNATCCLGEWYPLDSDADTGIYFKNQGNTNLSIQLNFSANASAFIGSSSPDPKFQ